MLRTLALVLLLANGLLLAAQFGAFDPLVRTAPQREPERLARQVNPELVRVLPPQAAGAALRAASQAATAASQALACLEAGPFGAGDAEVAERTLREAGLAEGAWMARKTEEGGAFMIYMGRYADRDALQRKLEELKRMKLETEDLHNPPELQPGLGLGRFDSKAAADAALARMVQRGLRTARVITLRPAVAQTTLKVIADAATRARLAGLRMPSGPGFVACATPAPSAAATDASAPAASSKP